ncbi:uncharacterized protein LOC141608131 [Silene latifolia]|uniref:uncharacterized protein LOC141608131 n=1 Tax=Silene latifolia TaxID=37657 RepID=UPI003D7733F9
MWRLDANFRQVISEGWEKEIKGTQMFQHVCKLKHLKHVLKLLNIGPLGDIENKVKVAKLALFKIQEGLVSNSMEPTLVATAKELSDELLNLKIAWHLFMERKAKVDWINMGDDNTQYFHTHLKNRRATKKFIQIQDTSGKLCTTSTDIQQAFISFYADLLGSSKAVDPVCAPIITAGILLNEAHHDILLAEVSSDEVKRPMFDICGNKAHGPDGFSSHFYKDTWDITG